MAMNELEWNTFKNYATLNSNLQLILRMIETSTDYTLYIIDGSLQTRCYIVKGTSDATEFETSYKSSFNLLPGNLATTQYELNNKTLKIAKGKLVMDGVNHSVDGYISVPGTFGDPLGGRYVSGGWGTISDYDPDDYVKIYVEDKDRLIATNLYSGASDAWMRANTPYTQYPIIGSYTDDDQPSEDGKGWFFWPVPGGYGEIELEPIGGYAYIPGGMYLEVILIRPNKLTGSFWFNVYWGKHE